MQILNSKQNTRQISSGLFYKKQLAVRNKIIVALDVDTLDKAKLLVKELIPHVDYFKVGLQLLTSVGAPKVVKFIHELGGKVFLDGKFNDIPNTMTGAAAAAAALGVKMFSVHACAGIEAMKAAARNKGDSKMLAVTVLTSLQEKDARLIFGANAKVKVIQFALDAKKAGADGIICSPRELELLGKRKEFVGLLKIAPCIRPKWAPAQDQKRIMTPTEAIAAGASMLVIGRPITKPPKEIGSPTNAVKLVAGEISKALTKNNR